MDTAMDTATDTAILMKTNKPLKILIMIPCFLKGGTEIQTLSLLKYWSIQPASIKLLVYFEYDEEMIFQAQQFTNVEIKLLKLQRSTSVIKLCYFIQKIISNDKVDLCHIQYMAPGLIPVIASRLAGIRNVYCTIHQPYTREFHSLKDKLFVNLAASLSKKFVSVSNSVEKSWFVIAPNSFGIYSCRRKKLTVIYNTIDVGNIEANKNFKEDSSVKVSSDKINIGVLSRLSREKGVDIVLNSIAVINKTRRDIDLYIFGDGEERITLEGLASELNLHNVSFKGAVQWNQGIRCLSIMDIVIVPSRFEGFGLVAAEAMSLGKPVIASDCYGLREVISHDYDGVLFSHEDLNSLVGHICRLADNMEERNRVGQNAHNSIKNKFNEKQFYNDLNSAYGRKSFDN